MSGGSPRIRILAVDDHPLVREGIAGLVGVQPVHAGKRSLSPEVSFQIAEHVSDQALTPAEIAVLRLIAAGNANKQIADQLAITEDTVNGRVKSILPKLDANGRTHAAISGLKRGIIEL
jgi:DNA-binding NarL/FixJ family response regulator